MEHKYGYWLPPNISAHGAGIDQLITFLHYFMAVLFIGWGIYLVYCLIAFRERPGHSADITPKHFGVPKFLEIGIVLIEVCLLVFFSYPIWAKVKTEFPNEKDAIRIDVTAEQFAWNIHYPGKDGVFGKTSIEKIDGTNPIGIDRESAEGKDDLLVLNEMKIPVNKPVIVTLRSKDVIHSFAIPVMRVKQDAIPGMDIPIWFEAKETGQYEIGCAQLCGIGHYRMKANFTVLSQEDYDKWLDEEHKALGLEAAPTAASTETK